MRRGREEEERQSRSGGTAPRWPQSHGRRCRAPTLRASPGKPCGRISPGRGRTPSVLPSPASCWSACPTGHQLPLHVWLSGPLCLGSQDSRGPSLALSRSVTSHTRRPSGQQRRLAFTLRARSLLSPPGGRTSNAGDAASRASGPSVGLSPALDSRACPWEGGLSL